MRTALLITALALVAALALVSVVSAQNSLVVIAQWGYPQRPFPAASPGQEMVPITVTVINPFPNIMIDNLKVKLELPFELTWYGEKQTCEVPVPLVPGKLTNYTCIFYVSVKPDAKPGMVKVKVKLDYVMYDISKGMPVYIGERSETHEVKLPIIGYSSISVIGAYFQINASLIGPGARSLPLMVQLMNTGTTTLYNVTVSLVLKPPLRAEVNGRPIHVLNKTIGILPPGRPMPVLFLVDLMSNTTGGCFYEELLVRAGMYAQAVFKKRVRICIPKVDVKVLGAQWGVPGLSTRMCIGPGASSVPLTVYIIPMSYIANASICLETRPPLLPSSPVVCRNMTLVGGRLVKLIYIVNLGYYTRNKTKLTLTVHYDNVTIRKQFEVALPKPEVKIISFIPTPPVLIQDLGTALLNITILNTGQGCAKNLKVYVALPEGISPVSKNYTNISIPVLPPGQPTPVIVPVVVGSVRPGQAPVKITLCMENKCNVYSYTVKVLSKPKFKVLSIKTENVYPGSDHGVLEVTLKYVSGPELATAIMMLSTPPTITVKTPGGETMLVPPQIVLANIKPGDIVRLAWRLDIDSSTPPRDYNASIVIKYIPRDLASFLHGSMLVTTVPVTIPVRETILTVMSKHIPEIGSAIIAIIAIGAVIAARRRRRR